MRKMITIILVSLVLLNAPAEAQETYFGKNKVRYKAFDWNFIQTRHFDIHFYEEAYLTAKFSATVLESAYVEISREVNYKLQKRVPVFVYNSHNDFQQTNIIPNLIGEGTGGFTEAFKTRIVIPFTGSYEDLRHVLHHELTHAMLYDMLYGNVFSSLISRQRLFALPLWFAEGYAEYSSRHGWDYFSDMFVRDATINGYLAPPQFLGGFLAYKQGQAMVKYIADEYGEEKLGEILRKGKIFLTLNKALKQAIGKSEEELFKEFSKEMRRRYWPEIAVRDEAEDVSEQLTHAREDGSYYNVRPEFSPEGDRLAIFTDKSDYTEIVMISSEDGKSLKSMVKSQRSGDLESLHSYVSGISFSPEGKRFVFVAKSKGLEALFFYDIKDGKTYLKRRFDYYNIISPSWSPEGDRVVFSALQGHKRNLFVYDIESDDVMQLTDERYDDIHADWLPGSAALIFSSDRPHPSNVDFDPKTHSYVDIGAYMPGDFDYGQYNLFKLDIENLEFTPMDVGPGHNKYPRVSPDGKKVAFISNRNGIDNIYVAYLDTVKYYALTNLLTGVNSMSWSPTGEQIAFSGFNKGAFDIFVMKDLVPKGKEGRLTLTNYRLGKYDLLKKSRANRTLAAHRQGNKTDETDSSDSSSITDEEYESYDVDPDLLFAGLDSLEADSSKVGRTDGAEEAADKDSVITESGVYDDEYVHIGKEEINPLDSFMIDIDSEKGEDYMEVMEEPALFDSVTPLLESGEYKINKYKAKFTPDYVGGGFSYDTFFGLRGQSYFVFSDYLGNHQIYLATDLVNTIDQSNLQIYYFYNRMRTRLGVGVFHTKNFYLDNNNFLFSDRFYGAQFVASRPFSVFSRLEFSASQTFIDRQYYDFIDLRDDRSAKVFTSTFSYIFDNIVWGITGPVNGRRTKISIDNGINLFDTEDINFTSTEFDFRRYWHISKTYSMALRFSGGVSFGDTPKLYFLGGTTNWVGSRNLDSEVYEVENLYFADVITPLRGFDYYGLNGTRYGLVNWEFRFPMIDYFAMRFPLRIVLSRVQGVIFTDIGAAWRGSDFKGGTTEGGAHRLQDIKTGFGLGLRANLGFIVLRYDQAWSTDFSTVSDKSTAYFSIGADF